MPTPRAGFSCWEPPHVRCFERSIVVHRALRRATHRVAADPSAEEGRVQARQGGVRAASVGNHPHMMHRRGSAVRTWRWGTRERRRALPDVVQRRRTLRCSRGGSSAGSDRRGERAHLVGVVPQEIERERGGLCRNVAIAAELVCACGDWSIKNDDRDDDESGVHGTLMHSPEIRPSSRATRMRTSTIGSRPSCESVDQNVVSRTATSAWSDASISCTHTTYVVRLRNVSAAANALMSARSSSSSVGRSFHSLINEGICTKKE